MGKTDIILIGAGGHCKSCIEIIEAVGSYTIAGILDEKEKIGKTVLGYNIIGTDDDIEELSKQDYSFLITIGQIKSAAVRKLIFERLVLNNAKIATIISCDAKVSRHAKIGAGVIVMHGVCVNADAEVGANCILNTGCIIEHDTKIGAHCHISTQAVINGTCVIGDEVFVGSGAVLINNITVHPLTVIGAGLTVYKNIEQSGTFVGKYIKSNGK